MLIIYIYRARFLIFTIPANLNPDNLDPDYNKVFENIYQKKNSLSALTYKSNLTVQNCKRVVQNLFSKPFYNRM